VSTKRALEGGVLRCGGFRVREKRVIVASVAFLMAPVHAGEMEREGAMRGVGGSTSMIARRGAVRGLRRASKRDQPSARVVGMGQCRAARAGESQREREGEGAGCRVGQLGSGAHLPVEQGERE
jgi:hypothetical protein